MENVAVEGLTQKIRKLTGKASLRLCFQPVWEIQWSIERFSVHLARDLSLVAPRLNGDKGNGTFTNKLQQMIIQVTHHLPLDFQLDSER